uniref:PDZ domain-containing protein n=1 Tax=Caenorhabditis japonica TaxID=281687 RepID=A0A8R1DML7_CAEJA
MTPPSTEQQLNRLTATFNFAMTKALAADSKHDWLTHLKAMSNAFTQACTAVTSEESSKKMAMQERDAALEQLVQVNAKVAASDNLIQQIHVLLAAKNRNSTDLASQNIFDRLCEQVRLDMKDIYNYRVLEARLKVEKWRNSRMLKHINSISKQSVMHLMATRFYARELAAMRQMMDLVHNTSSIETAVKSKLWDEIETENRLLRLNTLWLINRINSANLEDAPFENGDNSHSPPRLVILMREHINQGLGLEITGGCDQFRPVVVTGKLQRSMADDDQLLINDRILAVDGTFVTNTTTHEDVMQMLQTESAKDFIALIVSQFDPTKHPNGLPSPRHIVTPLEDSSTQSSMSIRED